jgi:DNA-directed RNA polymerase I subunit RPA49
MTNSSETGRILRYSGFDGEPILAKPLIIDDFGLVPSEKIESTLLMLNRSLSERRGEDLSLEGSTDRLDLFARSSSNDSMPFKYAVAIVSADPSEPVRIWDAQILTTEKRVKRLKAVEESDAARLGFGSVESAAGAAIDYKTAQNLLGEAFGTRKRKQAIVSMEKNKVRADSLGQPATEFIAQALSESKNENASLNASAEDVMASSLLPTFNKETLDVAEIYPVKGLIPAECYKALPIEPFIKLTVKSSKDEIDAIKAQFGMKDFWMNRILSAPRDDGYFTLHLLLFGHFLTSFRELKETAINGPDGSVAAVQGRLFECPEIVAADLLNRFADRIAPPSSNQNSASFLGKAKHKLPNTLRDKAILYILAVLLHLDSFRVNATSVAELLAITPTKLVTFFRALGCTIDRPVRGEEMNVNINNRLVPVKFARLTAPLTFPPPPKRQGKK